jgi:hypothetical protein
MKDVDSELEISLDLWILFLGISAEEKKMKRAILYSLDYQNKSGGEAEKVREKWYNSFSSEKNWSWIRSYAWGKIQFYLQKGTNLWFSRKKSNIFN